VNPTYDFAGQVALVAGGSSGMGLATARAFAEDGAPVVMADINESTPVTVTDELTPWPRDLGVRCDVSEGLRPCSNRCRAHQRRQRHRFVALSADGEVVVIQNGGCGVDRVSVDAHLEIVRRLPRDHRGHPRSWQDRSTVNGDLSKPHRVIIRELGMDHPPLPTIPDNRLDCGALESSGIVVCQIDHIIGIDIQCQRR
jgi:hypothetical protein